MAEVTFRFEGETLCAPEGVSLAAALIAAGHRGFRETGQGGQRGVFCGMGVCQDCLLSVDGRPGQRACMTGVAQGIEVRRQPALPDMAAAPPEPHRDVREIAPDVLVIGGGAAGLSAAIAARWEGASVTLLDERKVAGGQYYKQSFDGPPLDVQQAEGAALLDEARASGAEFLAGVEIWGAFDPLVFAGLAGDTVLIARPRAAVIATGAYERPVIVPGWTLPGVMTAGAAQTLWRSYRTLPGQRVAVAGSGPLNLQVALELAEGGADLALVAEHAPAPWTRPWATLRMAAAGPRLAWSGLSMLRRLRARGVPVLNATHLERIAPAGDALTATFRAGDTEHRVEVDALCLNGGFEPQNELLRLLGAEMRYDPRMGHLRTLRDPTMRTSVPGLFAAGDCCGLGGAPAARVEGRLAGRAAAAAAGHGDGHDVLADQRALARHRRFQARLWPLNDAAPASPDTMPDDTIVCRCEEVTAGQLRASLPEAPGHAGTLKRATRAGMGRCQGRYCAGTLARMIAEHHGRALDARSTFAPRVPVKPVPIAVLDAAAKALANAD